MSSTKSESLKGMKNEITLFTCTVSRCYHKLIIIVFRFPDTVTVLINAVGDSENSVNNVVIKSLTKIANTYPNEVIEIFCEYYTNTVKVNPTQLGNIVK